MKLFKNIFIIVLGVGFTFSCSANNGIKFSTVTINAGTVNNKSFKSMSRSEAPVEITGLTLTVTADDMEQIDEDIPLDTGILTVEIPAGDDREFSVNAMTGTRVSYTGSTTVNLDPDVETSVAVIMMKVNTEPGDDPGPSLPPADLSLYPYEQTVNVDWGQELDVILNATVTNSAHISAEGLDWEIYEVTYSSGPSGWLLTSPSDGDDLAGGSSVGVQYTVDSSIVSSSSSGSFTATIKYRNHRDRDDTESGTVTVNVGIQPASVSVALQINGLPFNDVFDGPVSYYSVTVGNVTENSADVNDPNVSLTIPPGKNFNVKAYAFMSSSDPSATTLKSWSGEAVIASLDSGINDPVPVEMSISATKLVVPDYLNNRVVQLDNIFDDSYEVFDGTALIGLGSFDSTEDFEPFDVDLDSNGRIYIANNSGSESPGKNRVFRMDDISGNGIQLFESAAFNNGVVTLTVDSNNGFVYYATDESSSSNNFFRSDLSGDNIISYDVSSDISIFSGLAVDDNGMVYIVGIDETGYGVVAKFDPGSVNIMEEYSDPDYLSNYTLDICDIVVKSSNVYVATGVMEDILQLDLSLDGVAGSLSNDPAPGSYDNFNGTRRFVGKMNKRFYVIDDSYNYINDRIVMFDNIAGANWTSNNPGGIFEFFYLYSPPM